MEEEKIAQRFQWKKEGEENDRKKKTGFCKWKNGSKEDYDEIFFGSDCEPDCHECVCCIDNACFSCGGCDKKFEFSE